MTPFFRSVTIVTEPAVSAGWGWGNFGMNKVALSGAMGVLAGGAAMALAIGGFVTPTQTMAAAAALSLGAAAAALTHGVLNKPHAEKAGVVLMTTQLKKAGSLIDSFPGRDGAVSLTVKSDQRAESFDVVKNPQSYLTKDITVTLKGGGSMRFNPVELKSLFLALKQQPNFIHLVLVDKHDEFIGYIPGFSAKREFTDGNAEARIAKYIVEIFNDDANSANLPQIDGAGKFDTISDEAKLSDVMERMAGGFRKLVVLKGGYHRKPIGLVNFSDLLSGSIKREPMSQSLQTTLYR